jgi:CRISPR system Cascade subunit CasD
MLAAAAGLERGEDISRFGPLTMAIRADHEGSMAREFQTAIGVVRADGSISSDAQMIFRDYLADACFHVAIAGEADTIERVHGDLQQPKYPLFLGRKSYVPSVPVVYPERESVLNEFDDPLEVLVRLPVTTHPAGIGLSRPDLVPPDWGGPTRSVRLVVTSRNPSEDTRPDLPLSFDIYNRQYASRFVETLYRDVPLIDDQEELE